MDRGLFGQRDGGGQEPRAELLAHAPGLYGPQQVLSFGSDSLIPSAGAIQVQPTHSNYNNSILLRPTGVRVAQVIPARIGL
jgi:hypothetical protein